MIHNWTVNYRGLGFRDIGWLLWLDCSNAALHIGLQRNGSKYCCHWFQTGLSWITAYFCPSFCPPEPIDMHRFNYTIKIRVASARWGRTIFGLKFHYVLPLYRKQMQRTIEMSTYIFFIFSVKVQTMECKFLLWPPPSLWSGSIFTHLDHMHSCHLLLSWRGTQLGFNKSRKMKTLNWKQPRADQV